MMLEALYSDALTCIAIGETRDDTRDALAGRVTADELDAVLRDALRDALRSGVEREDVDPSWFARRVAPPMSSAAW